MATSTYNVMTTAAVNKIWRTVQTGLKQGTNFLCEEWNALDDLQDFDVDYSTRSIKVPLDIYDDFGVASIPDGGFEALPGSVNADELSLTWITLNARFTVSKTAKWVQMRSPAAMIEQQMRFQGRKKLQALARRVSEYFWGFGTGAVALTSTVATQSSGAYTLKDAYSVTGLGVGTTPFNVMNFFEIGDRVALIRAAALVTNAIGVITAKTPATPSITITWNGSVTSANNDIIVFANSVENTTIAGTDWNQALTGVLDAMTSASLHGLATSTAPKWAVGYSTTAAARFNGITLRKMKQGIRNSGGGEMGTVWWSNGVENDVVQSQSAAVRFSDPFSMELDGKAKSRGVTFNTSRRVPAGYVFGWDKSSPAKMLLLGKDVKQPAWEDGYKLQDQSGFVFPVDLPCAMVWQNRGKLAYASSQQEA